MNPTLPHWPAVDGTEPEAPIVSGPTHGPFRLLRVHSPIAGGLVDARDRGGDPPRGCLLCQCARCGAVGPRARLEGRACEAPT